MKIAPWRLAAGLTLLGLAACKSSPSETATPKPAAAQPAPAAQPAETAGPKPPARAAEAAPVAA